jgi:hypothetical protein
MGAAAGREGNREAISVMKSVTFSKVLVSAQIEFSILSPTLFSNSPNLCFIPVQEQRTFFVNK